MPQCARSGAGTGTGSAPASSTCRSSVQASRLTLSIERRGPALPGLRHLKRLIGQFAAAGLLVDLVVSGDARPLPAAAERCAYRVVREALTNALRHSGTAQAEVRIHYAGGCLQVDVANDNPAGRGDGSAPDEGHGLRGMRERLEQIGGELCVRSGERFTVQARLPIPAAGP